MRWIEIAGNLWHVPGNRMKGRLPRIIPLPDEAMAILDSIRPSDPAPRDFVAHWVCTMTVHRFRTPFKSFCLDNLKHVLDEPAVEIAHDHAIGGKVAETYRDTSLIGHRRILNERWSSYLRGVAYTGLCEMPALSLVVDNAAVA